MTDRPSGDASLDALLADPRIDDDHLRAFPGGETAPLVLVGCVHDHPASAYRARAVVETLAPDAVGVELPGLALPLFERAGIDGADGTPVASELSAALGAADAVDARRAPIDTLDLRFLRSLWRELRERAVDGATLKQVAAAVGSVTGHALSCRGAAAFGERWPLSPTADSYEYDVAPTDAPATLADDERRRLTRSLSVLRALERPVANEVIDAAREATMAAALEGLTAEGSAVAVVGFDHLDGITDALRSRGFASDPVGPDGLAEIWD